MKNLNDTNKEYMTPSSYLNSNSKYSHANYYSENNIKFLRDKKDSLLSTQETCDSEYYKKLKIKDDLLNLKIEKENFLLKEKAEIDYLNIVLKDKEQQKYEIESNLNLKNVQFQEKILSNIFELENVNNTNIQIKLKNDLSVFGKRITKEAFQVLTIGTCKGNASTDEILDKEYKEDPDLMTLWAAYNII